MEGKLFDGFSKLREGEAKGGSDLVGNAVFKPASVGIEKNIGVIASALFVRLVVVRRIGGIDEDAETVANVVKYGVLLALKPLGKAYAEQVAKDGGGGIDGGDPLLFERCKLL